MLADPSDQATKTEELFRNAALQNHRATKQRPKGSCFNCGEPLGQDQLYCDEDCGIDYEKRMRK